jgi:Cu(I)/Ag(I) efflux system membrane protein CusA/SilA
MTARIVDWSARHPRVVLLGALTLALVGVMARQSLSRDAIPDLSDPQIVLVADWMGHPPSAVASEVTQVLADALAGIPGSTAVRGASMSGMGYVDVVFASPDDLAHGREVILDRVRSARSSLPPDVRVQVGPEASSTGWVYQYLLVDPSRLHATASITRLRAFQDEVVRPALAALPGVAEVASVGGVDQEVIVEARPDVLRARALAFTDLVAAVRPAAHGPVDLKALAAVPVGATGAPLRLDSVATLRISREMSSGLADVDGVRPAVGGIVVARRDADPAAVAERVRETLETLRAKLPAGIQMTTVYDRQRLVAGAGQTLLRALGEEIAVVVVVILIFLLHARSAAVPLTTLPFVLLLTFLGMWLFGVPATIMSLGGIGIALGMAVDAEVVALEACHRRLEGLSESASPHERRTAIAAAAGAFVPAILTSLLITALSFLPVFAFTGETGRLLRPLAVTKTLVILAAAVVALTLAPVLRDRVMRGRVRPELGNPLTRGLVRMYRPFVDFALRRPGLTLLTAACAVVSCVPIVPLLGREFLPRIDEGDLLSMPTTLPGVAPMQAAAQLGLQDRAIHGFAEVAGVFGKVGRASTATDPAPYSMAETTVALRPREEWPMHPRTRWYSGWAPPVLKRALGRLWPEEGPMTTPELVAALDRATRLPGWTNAWTAPVRARMDMMATGVRTPLGLRIVAADPARLDALGAVVQRALARVAGTRSAVFESLGGEPWLRFDPDRAALARHGVDPALVATTTALLLNGGQVGEMTGSGGLYRVRVATGMDAMRRAGPAMRPDQLEEVTVRSGRGGAPVPLALLGRTLYVTEPAMLRSERGALVAYVHVDLEDASDLTGYLERAQHALDEVGGDLRLGSGERIEWTGQYELLTAGERRLKWIAPLVLVSMLALLFLQFGSLMEALIVLVSVPFALVGSIWTLYLLGYPLSAPVWVGLLSTVGLAMQTGVVMVVYIDEAFHRRVRAGTLRNRDDIVAAHAEGTVRRLRPKIMTITTMAAGLLPLVWAEGPGAEIMRRVAAPMLGGLVTSAFLTLEVLPVLYTIWRYRQLRRSQTTARALATIVGTVPAWALR